MIGDMGFAWKRRESQLLNSVTKEKHYHFLNLFMGPQYKIHRDDTPKTA
jgi:hypothetical protein